jgi:hypothetical protein
VIFQPTAGRLAGRDHLIGPGLPRPEPDGINMSVEDDVDGRQVGPADAAVEVHSAGHWRVICPCDPDIAARATSLIFAVNTKLNFFSRTHVRRT